jgi:phospholipid/cholesterol/gamma-HCH transport system permease protein
MFNNLCNFNTLPKVIKILYICSFAIVGFYARVGRLVIYFSEFIFDLITLNFYKKIFFEQLVKSFIYALPVIFLTSFFTGAVLTLQTYSGLGSFASVDSLAKVVSLSIVKELCPVITGLIISGKLGSSLAAEIATMKISDQINALKTLSINPRKFIVTPITLGVTIAMPFLLAFSWCISLFGSVILIKTQIHSISVNLYLVKIVSTINWHDASISFIKVIVFGLCIGFSSCYIGINSQDGSKGVGMSTTNAVVVSSALILISNYIITYLFF